MKRNRHRVPTVFRIPIPRGDYWAAVHPFDLAGGHPNFMMDDEGQARLEATFGDNCPRLAALKKKFDPANLFRVNKNIRPG